MSNLQDVKLVNLAKYRYLKGMTQGDLAEAVGTTQDTVSEWENGKRLPHPRTLMKLTEVLGIGAPLLTGEVEDRPYRHEHERNGISWW